ncbi:copper amine oxidase N-terminal domain-containing protein [Paenibacillus dokdonensis]|uniref:Copper amine oxidase N-terminal domain-containing protein n=2 Tax=Paenibacillus dokdonensis TaxID=2567944 RepID=A0ABU6GGK6_9BACL|nr:copper amine oxidase N-terminal domain-containing protein [Paenibacillus dokdonensis]MEC0238839.1 copper amine oxidase N-terminal domain-containing protein [Paenibacillus dokdonensis]
MNIKQLITYASSMLLISALSTQALLPASASSAPEKVNVQLTFNSTGLMTSSQDAIIKNGVSYLSSSLLTNYAKLEMRWDQSGNRVEFTGFDKRLAIRVGSHTGLLDGKTVELGAAPFLFKDELYLPAKFVVTALQGGAVHWESKTRTIQADHLHRYPGMSENFEGTLYSLSYDTGDLFVSSGKENKRKVANLGTGLDIVHFKFEHTSQGLVILRVFNVYGEPHLYTDDFILLLKNGSVFRQANIGFHNTFGEPALWADGKLLLNDGHTLRIIEDGTGKVLETVHLSSLMGTSGDNMVSYNVEAWYPDIALIRPTDTGFLTLVDRSTGNQTLLYKELFKWNEQQQDEVNDPMFPGDHVYFTGRSGDKLNFNHTRGNVTQKFTHTLTAEK